MSRGHGCRTTYETHHGHGQGTRGVEKRTPTVHVHILGAGQQIPCKVAGGKTLHHASGAGVAPNSFFPVHVPSLLVGVDDPQGQSIDETGLDHGHKVDVPVDLLLPRKLRVGFRSNAGGDIGRDDAIDEFVEAEGGEDLVGMVREGLESEALCKGCDGFCEEIRRGEERVTHPEIWTK